MLKRLIPIIFGGTSSASGSTAPPVSFVLREDGSFVLREDGSKILREG